MVGEMPLPRLRTKAAGERASCAATVVTVSVMVDYRTWSSECMSDSSIRPVLRQVKGDYAYTLIDKDDGVFHNREMLMNLLGGNLGDGALRKGATGQIVSNARRWCVTRAGLRRVDVGLFSLRETSMLKTARFRVSSLLSLGW